MASAKLPALQFYPGDWRKDVGVQSLTFHDRGVWFEMLMLMHESEPRGLLILNGNPMTEDSLSRVLGLDKQILTTTITTLLTTGVASRDDNSGALMCRRMVRDEKLHQIRREAGKLGGNPSLLMQKTTTGDKQILTPSSSSSTASSTTGGSTTAPPIDKPAKVELTEAENNNALEPAQCAFKMFEEVGIVVMPNLMNAATQAITITAKNLACTPYAAMLLIKRRAKMTRERGEAVTLFWFTDGKYEKDVEEGVGNGTNREHQQQPRGSQRVNQQLDELAKLRDQRASRPVGGGSGEDGDPARRGDGRDAAGGVFAGAC